MTFLEEITQPGIASIIASVITTTVALNGLFIKWLISNFHKTEQSIKEIAQSFDKHEDHDQRRHEENLYRFEKISVALARLGSSNGTHDKEIT